MTLDTPTLDAADDIHADIRAAFASDDPPAPASPTEPELAPVEAPAAPVEGETPAEAAARHRDEKGQFAKAPETEQPAQQVAPGAEPQQPVAAIMPPVSWKAAAKAKFATLDPEVQQEVLRREKEITDGLAQWDQKVGAANKLDALLAPHDQRLALAGSNRENYLRGLLTADDMLRGPNREQALAQIARMYGIPLPTGQPQPQQQQAAPQVSPQHVGELVQTELQRWREQESQAAADSTIAEFAANPANLYFDNVKAEMGALLQAGAATTLKEAYDMACHARPDIRALLTPAPVLQSAKPAQPAGLSVTGSPPIGGHKAPPNGSRESIEDDIRAALSEVTGRI